MTFLIVNPLHVKRYLMGPEIIIYLDITLLVTVLLTHRNCVRCSNVSIQGRKVCKQKTGILRCPCL